MMSSRKLNFSISLCRRLNKNMVLSYQIPSFYVIDDAVLF